MDSSKIGLIAAEAMEIFEREFGDGKDAVIMEAAIVFEVSYINDEGDKVVETPTACTNDSRVYQTGLFTWGLEVVTNSGNDATEDDEDDDDGVD
jgi:hypothetical protein